MNRSVIRSSSPEHEASSSSRQSQIPSRQSASPDLVQRAIAAPSAQTLTPAVIRVLQATRGNRFVQRLIARAESSNDRDTPSTASTSAPAKVQRIVVLKKGSFGPYPSEDGQEPRGQIYVFGEWEAFDHDRWISDEGYRQRISQGWNEPAPQDAGGYQGFGGGASASYQPPGTSAGYPPQQQGGYPSYGGGASASYQPPGTSAGYPQPQPGGYPSYGGGASASYQPPGASAGYPQPQPGGYPSYGGEASASYQPPGTSAGYPQPQPGGYPGYGGGASASYQPPGTSAGYPQPQPGGYPGYGGGASASYQPPGASAGYPPQQPGGYPSYGGEASASYQPPGASAGYPQPQPGGFPGYGGGASASYQPPGASAGYPQPQPGGFPGYGGQSASNTNYTPNQPQGSGGGLAPQPGGFPGFAPQERSIPGGFPDLAPDLVAFLEAVWENREAILSQRDEQAALRWIYSKLYAKEGSTERPQGHISVSKQVLGLVKLALRHKAFLQEGSRPIEELVELWQQKNTQAAVKAYQELSYRYYYFRLHQGRATARVLVHTAYDTVHTDFAKLLSVLQENEDVIDVKVAGPMSCFKKPDSMVIYVKDIWTARMLAANIEELELNVVNVLPALTEETSEGVAIADDPPAVQGTPISFGQKRAIVAFLALKDARSFQDMLWNAVEYVVGSGIDEFAPSRERQQQTKSMEAIIAYYLGIMNRK